MEIQDSSIFQGCSSSKVPNERTHKTFYLLTNISISIKLSVSYDSSLNILNLVFHSSFKQCCPLGSSYRVGRVLSIGL